MAARQRPAGRVSSMAGGAAARCASQFVELLLANLDPGDVAFLTRIAILDRPASRAVPRVLSDTQRRRQRLARLARDTPVFVAGRGQRLAAHALAGARRAAAPLRAAARRPSRPRCIARARRAAGRAADCSRRRRRTRWPPASARPPTTWPSAACYESLMARGRQGAVLDVAGAAAGRRGRPPAAPAAGRRRGRWRLSERHEKPTATSSASWRSPDVDDALRCECALIQSGAAVYADDPDRFAALHDPWARARR